MLEICSTDRRHNRVLGHNPGSACDGVLAECRQEAGRLLQLSMERYVRHPQPQKCHNPLEGGEQMQVEWMSSVRNVQIGNTYR